MNDLAGDVGCGAHNTNFYKTGWAEFPRITRSWASRCVNQSGEITTLHTCNNHRTVKMLRHKIYRSSIGWIAIGCVWKNHVERYQLVGCLGIWSIFFHIVVISCIWMKLDHCLKDVRWYLHYLLYSSKLIFTQKRKKQGRKRQGENGGMNNHILDLFLAGVAFMIPFPRSFWGAGLKPSLFSLGDIHCWCFIWYVCPLHVYEKQLFMHVQILAENPKLHWTGRSFGPNGFQSTGRSKDGSLAGKDWHVMEVSPRKLVHEKKLVLFQRNPDLQWGLYIFCQKHGWKQ